jgi:hypothetical protein
MLSTTNYKKIKDNVFELLTTYNTKEICFISADALNDKSIIPQTELHITEKDIVLTHLDNNEKKKIILNFKDMNIKQNLPEMGVDQFDKINEKEFITFSKKLGECFKKGLNNKLTMLTKTE